MALPVALQLYSVRDSMEADLTATLKKIKAMGYDGVEFAGLFGHDPMYIKGLCEGLGLVPISAHIPLADMLADPDGVFAAYETIGCKYAVVPYVTEERRPGAEKFFDMIEEIKMLGKKAAEHGMTLLYHNHDFEFAKVDGEYGLDVLYDRVPSDLLQTELDTCWVNVAGVDPVSYIGKYSGRTPVVHLKDFFKSGKLPDRLYALIGLDEDEETKEAEEESVFEFRPCGHGLQDMPAIIEASEKSGARWVVVEQDEPSMGLTRMECVMVAREYLRTIGV
ncbi:MAG: sugar phosphate isomerase/epimerase [Ruminococcaceae bacterium]|nr:sugar phosphate isomerase/epimerase [Oscillospiraceae bacterium]